MPDKFAAEYRALKIDETGRREITFAALPEDAGQVALIAGKLREQAASGKTALEIQVSLKRKRRSRNANAALWDLLGQMAAALSTSKDELYIEMLARYGVYTHIVVKPHIVERLKAEWRAVRELGTVTVNGKEAVQVQCFFGSSGYNSKEFGALLDGVINEARELGIYLVSDAERDALIESWARETDVK
jgi:hypothetical protein